jgi:protein-disulfide isomerase
MRINMYDEAVLGSPEAPYVIVELMDYTCPHCREMHKKIRRAKERYGDQLAVVIMPVPLELECNKIVPATSPEHRGACGMARRALAVGEISPEKFVEFHNWLLANEKQAPSAAAAVRRAFSLVDRTKLSALSDSDEIKGRIQKYIRLFSRLSDQYSTADKPFGLPVLIVGDTVLTGKIETVDELCAELEKAIDIKPL